MITIRNRPVCIFCVCFLTALCIYLCFVVPNQNKKSLLEARGISQGDEIVLSGKVNNLLEKENFNGKYMEVTLKNVYFHSEIRRFSEYENKTEKLKLTQTGQNVICMMMPDESIKIGRQIYLSGTLSYFDEARNPGEFNQKQFYQQRGTIFSITDAKLMAFTLSYGTIRQFLYEFKKQNEILLTKYVDAENAAILKAMLFGNKSEIDTDVKELFQKNGIAHILAISGLHLSLIGMSIYRCLNRLPIPLWTVITICEIIMILYCIMVGFSASAFRALFMFSLFLFAKVVKRTYDLITALAASCISILLMQPGCLFDCAFLLSFSALVGIGVLLPQFIQNYWKPHRFLQSMFASGFVFLVTLPILLSFYYEAAFYSVLLNIIVIPLMTLLMGSAFFLLIVAWLLPQFTFVPAFAVDIILKIYKVSCIFLEKYGMGRSNTGKPQMWQIVLYYLILFGIFFLHLKNNRKKITVLILGLAASLIILLYHPHNEMNIYMLDVGQGDGCVVINENRKAYLIDGGSSSKKNIGKKCIIPFLKYKGINEIEAIFISHPDMDHMNGIEEILQKGIREHIHVKQIFVTKGLMDKKEYESILLIAQNAGTKIIGMEAGDRLVDQNLIFTCLYPFKNSDMEDLNNASLVLDISYKDFRMLCTGDVKENGEVQFIQKTDLSSQYYDILKVSHHGSNTSTSRELLDWAKPEVALVSAGANNSYGHPHREVLERLQENNILYMKTMDYGAIMIWTDGDKIKIQTFLDGG